MTTPVQLLGKQHSGEGETEIKICFNNYRISILAWRIWNCPTNRRNAILSGYFFIASLLVIAAVISIIHFIFNYYIEDAEKKKKVTLSQRSFGVSGLLILRISTMLYCVVIMYRHNHLITYQKWYTVLREIMNK